MLKKLIILCLIFNYLTAENENVQVDERESWFFDTKNTKNTANPSNLKYYKFYDLLPDTIAVKVFEEQDLSVLNGKKLYAGYSTVDPSGKDCKIFPASSTGYSQDVTVCLPWWRIEREYIKTNENFSSGVSDLIKSLKKQTPPIMVDICRTRKEPKIYPGGNVTCTSYFDTLAGGDCKDNPEQAKCYVNNCGTYLNKYCDLKDIVKGEVEELDTAVTLSDNAQVIKQESTKVKLSTMQYVCPSGSITDGECIEKDEVMMFPATCVEDDPATDVDESEKKYCEKSDAVYVNNELSHFTTTCNDGRTVKCEIDKFYAQKAQCLEPIYEESTETEIYDATLTRTYETKEVDVLSGEIDVYSGNESCLRANTVEEARNQELFVKIVGSGSLDDDIYILRHAADGSHTKVYCNMQHAENIGNRKSYNGEVLQCIDNNGNYSFNSTVNIESTDIVTVQQNSENENANGTPFAIGRNHYNSSKVTIDGITVAPQVKNSDYPYYPANGVHLRTWDNTTSTFSILFPFAGAYEIFFYNKDGKEMAKTLIDLEDFKAIATNGYLPLELGQKMELAPNIEDDILDENGNTITYKANRKDSWVEWGGGVFGGRHSKIAGKSSSSPNDSYVKQNAVTNVIVKDLLTGAITPMPMVYPIAYPNRIFVSKLKVYEHRKYRCYAPFSNPNLVGSGKTSYACSTSNAWQDYKNDLVDIENVDLWIDNPTCEQNCRDIQPCVASGENFTCTQRGNDDIGGDIEGNLFSSQELCNANCFTQNSCESYNDSNCELVEEKEHDPATDINGKTIYRKKTIAYRCVNQVKEQVGCSKYNINVIQGDLEYNFGLTGWEEKDFSADFEEAVTSANMLEVGSQHIWSGWKGKCVKGKKWDFSYLSDPMTIASYAYSAYQAYTWNGWSGEGNTDTQGGDQSNGDGNGGGDNNSGGGNTGDGGAGAISEAAKQTYTTMQSSWDTFTETISKKYTEAMKMLEEGVGTVTKPVTSFVSDTTESMFSDIEFGFEVDPDSALGKISSQVGKLTKSAEEFFDEQVAGVKDLVKENIGIDWDGVVLGEKDTWFAITQGDIIMGAAQTAHVLMAPTIEQYALADRMLGAYNGYSDETTELQAFNNCMASIGASLPNLIAWSAGSKDGVEELIQPWEHPLRMTVNQLAAIKSVTSEQYMISNYVYKTDDNILLDVKAVTAAAYLKATQVVCMGEKVYQASAQIEESKQDGNGSMFTAFGLAKMAIGMVCPPCSFAMTVVMDLYTNVLASVDTCGNEQDALEWSMNHFKTHKFLNHEQCVLTRSYCDKDTTWFGCVRQGYDYCCYDQITTKVFAEGLKDQMFAPGDKTKWARCNDITINDLKDMSFRQCESGENPYDDKCFNTSKYSEFKQVLFRQSKKGIDVEGLAEQVINSMAIETSN